MLVFKYKDDGLIMDDYCKINNIKATFSDRVGANATNTLTEISMVNLMNNHRTISSTIFGTYLGGENFPDVKVEFNEQTSNQEFLKMTGNTGKCKPFTVLRDRDNVVVEIGRTFIPNSINKLCLAVAIVDEEYSTGDMLVSDNGHTVLLKTGALGQLLDYIVKNV